LPLICRRWEWAGWQTEVTRHDEATHRRGFVAWVRDRHAEPVDYEAMEAEVGRLEAQLAEVARLVKQGIFTEEETHAN
jgi:hypothetical protein